MTRSKISLADKIKAREQDHPDAASPHLIIQALAGTGKTTTLVEGLKGVKGIASTLAPSAQQAAIWDAMALSVNKVSSICFVAFNKSIAMELQSRVPAGCDASTLHSLGYKTLLREIPGTKVNEYRLLDIISEVLDIDVRVLRKEKGELLYSLEKLVRLSKMNLLDGFPEDIATLIEQYDLEIVDGCDQHVPAILQRCRETVRTMKKVDFDDMIWIPVVEKFKPTKYDLLLVDESQDLNRCQQALARMAGRRLILCGDTHQAIYGFAGADAKSMTRMEEELKADERGCLVFPLTSTRRCGRRIVEEAKAIVPEFEAHESNAEGTISKAKYPTKKGGVELKWEETYCAMVKPGDFLICRVNAPLVSQCFRFLKRGMKANIQGRDVGKGLISTIKKIKAATVAELVGGITDWLYKETAKENAKRVPSESRLIALQDRHDCILAFTNDKNTIDEVIQSIEAVFTDDKKVPGIRLSSIHKAKGLEAKRVFLLEPEGGTVPHPMAKKTWEISQEYNLRYVAITRAIETLVYVS